MFRYFQSVEEPNIFWRFENENEPGYGYDNLRKQDGWEKTMNVFLRDCIEDGDIELSEKEISQCLSRP